MGHPEPQNLDTYKAKLVVLKNWMLHRKGAYEHDTANGRFDFKKHLTPPERVKFKEQTTELRSLEGLLKLTKQDIYRLRKEAGLYDVLSK